MTSSPAWFQSWFDSPLYRNVYRHRDSKEAERAGTLFRVASGLEAGARVLDLACGGGRHAVALAKAGFRVVGTDLSPTLLGEARCRVTEERVPLPLVRSDMRRIPFGPCFDAVVQWFTAFGYFATDAENASVFTSVREVLVPEGWYLLDFMNAEEVRQSLVPRTESREGDFLVLQERAILAGRVEKRITVSRNGEDAVFHESVRLYSRVELEAMMRSRGFTIVACYGDYDGAGFTVVSPRCIILARKGGDE